MAAGPCKVLQLLLLQLLLVISRCSCCNAGSLGQERHCLHVPPIGSTVGAMLSAAIGCAADGTLAAAEHLRRLAQASKLATATATKRRQQHEEDAEDLFPDANINPAPTAPLKTADALLAGATTNVHAGALELPPPFHNCNDTVLRQNLHIPVTRIRLASSKIEGFIDIKSDEDQQHVYDAQLEPDIAYWRGRNLSMASLDEMVAQTREAYHPPPDTLRRIAIIKNQIYWLDQDKAPFRSPHRVDTQCVQPCNGQFGHWEQTMRRFLQQVAFPDVVFELSVYDFPTCRLQGRSDRELRPEADSPIDSCAAPVLSMQKTNSYVDILVPILHDIAHPLYLFPHELKVNKAFLRATAFCDQPQGPHQGFVQCARSYFARRVRYGGWGDVMEAGLTTGYGDGPGEASFDADATQDGVLPALGFFPLPDHARFKIVLDTDGVVAAFRSSKLMHTNSAVFKQKTPYYEWYGKLLQDGKHFVSFWHKDRDDVIDLLQQWRNRDAELKNISLNAMQFAYRYTSPRARMLYWRQALVQYKSLFPDMDDYISRLDIGAAAST